MGQENEKTFKRNYKVTIMLIVIIFILMMLCFAAAFYLSSNSFWMSLFLNIGGGIVTGLIILIYQLFTDKKKNYMKSIIDQMEKLSLFENYELQKRDFWDEEIMCEEDYDRMLEAPMFCSNEHLCYVLSLSKKRIDSLLTIEKNLIKFYDEIYTFRYPLFHFSKLLNDAKNYFGQFDSEVIHGFQIEYDENGEDISYKTPDGNIIQEGHEVRYNILNFQGHEAEVQTEQIYEKWMFMIHELNVEALKINEAIISERKESIDYFSSIKLF